MTTVPDWRPRMVEVRGPGAAPLLVVVVGRLRIGRSGDGLIVGDPLLSRQHFELLVDGDLLVLEDLGSTGGTRCNGTAVDGPMAVGRNDEITAGATTIHIDPPVPGWPTSPTSTPLRPPVPHQGDPGPRARRPGPPAKDPAAPVLDPAATVRDRDRSAEPRPSREAEALAASVVGGTLTIAFSDIVDSTALNSQLGDREWFAALQRHNEVLRGILAPHHGREIKGQGDGFMLTFPSARHGVGYAMDVQRALGEARAEDPAWPVHVRIGLHTGEVIRDGGDIFGWHVNLAARIAGAAGSDEIVVSSLVRDLLGPVGEVTFDPPRPVDLRGVPGAHQVHPVRWRERG